MSVRWRYLGAFAMLGCASYLWATPITPVVSTFDTGLDGWTMSDSCQWRADGGNPGGYIWGNDENFIEAARAYAPASYLGDWSALDGAGSLLYDYRRIDNGGGSPEFFALSAWISGPGGQAVWRGPIITEPTPWITYEVPIEASSFYLWWGSWAGLRANVSELWIAIETVSGETFEDQAGIDNVILTPEPSSAVLCGLAFACVLRRSLRRG